MSWEVFIAGELTHLLETERLITALSQLGAVQCLVQYLL